MRLTREENDMLDGKHGYPAQKAMEILVGLGDCYDAEKMIPVHSAHLLYNALSLGKGGSLFMQDMAEKGGKFAIHTDTNPSSLVGSVWKDFGFSEEYARNQLAVGNAIVTMGGFLADTCAPYMAGNVPRMGEHIAWNETSAIIFANSVLGARTNREGGPSAVAAAITGRVPAYGYHLDHNRYGDLKIRVTAKLTHLHDYGTLGYFAGKLADDKIPVLDGIPPSVSWDELKLMGACMSTSGSVTLYHIIGITPEAPTEEIAFGKKNPRSVPTYEFGEKELHETEAALSKATGNNVDTVILGCPHASISELRDFTRLLTGKKVKSGIDFWITTTRMIKAYSDAMGYTAILEQSGAKILCDTCPVSVAGSYARDKRSRKFATNSAKLPYYIGQYLAEGQEMVPHYGSTEQCIASALTGSWR